MQLVKLGDNLMLVILMGIKIIGNNFAKPNSLSYFRNRH